MNKSKNYPIVKSESEWYNELSDEEFRVLRKKGTELPFTGKYNNHFDKGIYRSDENRTISRNRGRIFYRYDRKSLRDILMKVTKIL